MGQCRSFHTNDAGQSIPLAPGATHSLHNGGTAPLELVEVLLDDGSDEAG